MKETKFLVQGIYSTSPLLQWQRSATYAKKIYTGGTPFRNTPFLQHFPLFATLFWEICVLPRDPFLQHFEKKLYGMDYTWLIEVEIWYMNIWGKVPKCVLVQKRGPKK